MLPEAVLEQAKAEMLDWRGSGMSVMEMSHRGKEFVSIAEQAEADLRELLDIPANYRVLFLQGGASSQFAMAPMNLLRGKTRADYLNTGQWSKKAISEAKKEDWKASLGMSSIMGSARGTYTPDVVMVIQPLSVEEHAPPKTKKEDLEKAGLEKLDELVEQGVALMRLRIVKGRDGVFRRGFELAFHFESLRFEETVFSSWLGSSE